MCTIVQYHEELNYIKWAWQTDCSIRAKTGAARNTHMPLMKGYAAFPP